MASGQRNWHCLQLKVPAGDGDTLAACCFALDSCGLESAECDQWVEITAYFDGGVAREQLQGQLLAMIEKLALEPSAFVWKRQEQEDWEREWRQFFKPIWISPHLVVHPSWSTVEVTADQIRVVIDPKMAFGTGGHESTRLCLEWLETLISGPVHCLDLGCGSGILSIAAAKLGAAAVVAVDNDPLAVDNSGENLSRNGVEDQVSVYLGSIEQARHRRFELILANIQSHILSPMLPEIKTCLEPGGRVLFSGLLSKEATQFGRCLEENGLVLEQTRRRQDWLALLACNAG